MNFRTSLLIAPLAAVAPTVPLRAQGQDPGKEIKELARRIDEQLHEIDRLLLESGKKDQARTEPQQKLREAIVRSTSVDEYMDALIEKLLEMKNQSGGGSGQDQQQQQQQQQDQQQDGQQPQQSPRNGPRRENQAPQFVQQPQDGQQQGQQQDGQKPDGQQPGGQQPDGKQQGGQQPGGQQPGGGGDPKGGQEEHTRGENTTGNRRPDSERGPGNRGEGDEGWGELQSYTNFLKNRGSAPKVPEKFRKYWEAYLKGAQSQDKGR